MEMIETFLTCVIPVLFSTLITAIVLWAGMKITRVDGTFLGMVIIALGSTLVSLVPTIGWTLSVVVMFFLIVRLTSANFWPDAVLMVVIAELVLVIFTVILADQMIQFHGEVVQQMIECIPR